MNRDHDIIFISVIIILVIYESRSWYYLY